MNDTSKKNSRAPRGAGLEQKHCYTHTHEISSENMNRLGQVSSGNMKGLERGQ